MATDQPVAGGLPLSELDRGAEYINFRCVEGCGRRYSAGRTRCEECHIEWQAKGSPPHRKATAGPAVRKRHLHLVA